jgi:hypothetical protein
MLLTPETLQQIQTTARICVRQLDERIAADERQWVKLQLQSYQKIWESIALNPHRFLPR